MTIDPALQLLVRAALALLFATAAWHKLRTPAVFTATLAAYRLLPAVAVAPAAAALVTTEVALAVCLALPGSAPARAGEAAAALLVLYSAAIGANLVRGRRDLDCGCSGPARRQRIRGWLLARNGLVACGAGLLALPTAHRALHWVDAVTVAGGVAALSLLWQTTHALLAEAPGSPATASTAGGIERG